MAYLSADDTSTLELSLKVGCWVLNFFDSLAALFIALFIMISHDDLESGCIEPSELS